MATLYIALKHFHLTTVALTILLFLFRSALMLWYSKGLNWRWVRVVPHVIDTLLLLSGIGLMFLIQQYPLVNGWLTAKVAGLLLYILFGTVALKRGRTRKIRYVALLGALLSLGYLVSVARTHSATLGLF
ncbi:SirB2 family protein [Marinobacterium mangrovicola]|uniref:Putative membrane protein SirB2 n=1 Tax=Marinobacterium mangrovicola TaxID=1476959 RepID=A0A4R1GCI2_9GAMM|nr:SirB2 family protein [Marinobacterium mangrovicola]TCK05967.1 putative membrane protein SirB2 [Marinobacterium mangrovicola]